MENNKGIWGMIFLFLIILTFVIGGFFSMKYFSEKADKPKRDEKQEEKLDLRIDKTKDYVYYTNGKEVLGREEIHKEDAVLNFSTLEKLNETLHNENEALFQELKYTKDVENVSQDAESNDEGIYSLKYREYEDAKYADYISLVVKDYYYDIVDGTKAIDLKSYVVDLETGKLYSEKELLNTFSITEEIIKNSVKKRLEDTQTLAGEEFVIDVDGTLNNLDKRAIFVNGKGKIEIYFIVKCNQASYNDSVEIN